MIRAVTTPLAKAHDLGSFCSGDNGLDDWLHRSARPMGGQGLNRTHLWVDEDDGAILGYFALTPTIVTTDEHLEETAPALLLAKLALCEQMRGQNPPVGDSLLLAAFETVLRASDLVGGRFLATDTRNDKAAAFYSRNGFEPIEGNESRLIIKVSAIRRLFD